MEKGTKAKPVLGFKGPSSLSLLESFNITTGMVPDYMHCILLGFTKVLLCKWFSSTQSKFEYFVGHSLKSISSRLQSIKPPDFMERLPRDIEKHYGNLKATELQAWLLFYSLPCLSGILPHKYLEHFSLLSEAIYLLLDDFFFLFKHNSLRLPQEFLSSSRGLTHI